MFVNRRETDTSGSLRVPLTPLLYLIILSTATALAQEDARLVTLRHEFHIGIVVKARTFTILSTATLAYVGKEDVHTLRFSLPAAAMRGAVKVDKRKVKVEADPPGPPRARTRAYTVTLPEPLKRAESVTLTVDYTLPHQGQRLEWQLRRDYAMGWSEWFPQIEGAASHAAPYRMTFDTSSDLIPVTPGLRTETERHHFVYDCPVTVEPFFVAGTFRYYGAAAKPFHADTYAVISIREPLVKRFIVPSLLKAVRVVGQAVGEPAYSRGQFVVANQKKLFFEDRPFFIWLTAEWWRSPNIARMHSARVGTKVARMWFVDSWQPEGPQSAMLSWGLASYFGWLCAERLHGQDQARHVARRFQQTLNLKELHGEPQVDVVGPPRERPHLLSFSPHAMLRFLLGEEAFHGSLRKLFEERRGRVVRVRDLADRLRTDAGEDLDWFFTTWIRNGALAEYRIERKVEAVAWEGGVATAVTVRNSGKGRMKVVLEARSLTGEMKRGWFWLDDKKEKRRTLHLVTKTPLEWIEVDPDKIIPQTSIENDRWTSPPAKEPFHTLRRESGRVLRGRIIDEEAAYYRVQIGSTRTMLAKSTLSSVETTPFGKYVKRLNEDEMDHASLARLCAKEGWAYEARFHALAFLTDHPDNLEMAEIAKRFKQ